VATPSPQRLRADLASLVHREYGLREFALGAARILRRAVPFDGVCVLTLDPATLLPTGEVVENGLPPEATARMTHIEMAGRDFNNFSALAHASPRVATLSEATGGDLDRSVRHRDVRREHGFGDELRAALVGERATWGALTLLRERDGADFTPRDAQIVAELTPEVAEGLRRTVMRDAVGPAAADEHRQAGTVVLEPDDSIALADPTGEAWVADLLERETPRAAVPHVIVAVAGRARAAADGDATAAARVRVRTASGRWLVIRGSIAGDGPDRRSVVTLAPAGTPELAPLIADAYELTERERAVTQLVAQGLSTEAIAQRLFLSPWTVQDHLKAIFEKTGTGTRGELVAHLFFEHYAPRLTEPAER